MADLKRLADEAIALLEDATDDEIVELSGEISVARMLRTQLDEARSAFTSKHERTWMMARELERELLMQRGAFLAGFIRLIILASAPGLLICPRVEVELSNCGYRGAEVSSG